MAIGVVEELVSESTELAVAVPAHHLFLQAVHLEAFRQSAIVLRQQLFRGDRFDDPGPVHRLRGEGGLALHRRLHSYNRTIVGLGFRVDG